MSIEFAPEEIYTFMPAPLPGPLVFKAIPLCSPANGQLPHSFQLSNGRIYSVEEFKTQFALEKWIPIMVAQGMKEELFQQLIEANEEYGRQFKYEWDLETLSYYIVDQPSHEHEYYSGLLTYSMLTTLKLHFFNAIRAFRFLASPGIRVNDARRPKKKMSDYSIWISKEFILDPKTEQVPFFVVETAVSQTLPNLEAKIDFWIRRGVSTVIGINRDERRREIDVIIVTESVHQPIRTFKFEQIATFDFHLSKQILSSGYNIENFDMNPTFDDIHVFVEGFLVE